MQITKTSMISGVTRTLEIDVTPEQLTQWANGKCIQDVAPHLSPAVREFLMTGITADEWDKEIDDDEPVCDDWEYGPY